MTSNQPVIRLASIFIYILAAGFFLPKIGVDNSLTRWLSSSSEAAATYAEFLEDFGTDALLVLILDTGGDATEGEKLAKDLDQLRQLDYITGISDWPPPYVQHKKEVDARYRTFLIGFRPESHTSPHRPELLDQIESLMQGHEGDYYVAGTGVISRAINSQTSGDASRFLLIGFVVLLLFLIYFIRDTLAILQTLLVALAAIATLVIISGTLGITMGVAHTVIPIVILFYSTSVSMHILAHGGDFRKVLSPSLWVTGTTVLGFSAFLPSSIPLLRDFALLGITGIAGVLGASFWVFYPQVYPYGGTAAMGKVRKVATYQRSWLPRTILVLALICTPGLWLLKSEISSLSILNTSSIAYRDHQKVEELAGAYFPLEYVVDDAQTPRRELSRWVREVYEIPEVNAVAAYHRFPPMADLQAIGYRSLNHPDQHRVTFFVPLLSTTQGRVLADRIEDIGNRHFTNGRPELSGFMPLYSSLAHDLLRAFRYSLFFGFVVICVMMGLYLRDWKLLIPAMLINALPIVAMLGLMGWLGIRLDMVTIPIGCLLLSIVVDDTIHFMHWYKRNRDADEALRKSGPGIVLTSVIISAGFAILLFSGAPPVKYFGLLSITAVVFALVSDLFVLPWLLTKKPFK